MQLPELLGYYSYRNDAVCHIITRTMGYCKHRHFHGPFNFTVCSFLVKSMNSKGRELNWPHNY